MPGKLYRTFKQQNSRETNEMNLPRPSVFVRLLSMDMDMHFHLIKEKFIQKNAIRKQHENRHC